MLLTLRAVFTISSIHWYTLLTLSAAVVPTYNIKSCVGSYLNTAQLTSKFNAAASSSRANFDTCKVLWSPCSHSLLASNSITTHRPTPQGHIRARIRSKASLIVGDIHVADQGEKRESLVSKVMCTQPMNLIIRCGYT